MNKALVIIFMGAFTAFAIAATDKNPVATVTALTDEVEINNPEDME